MTDCVTVCNIKNNTTELMITKWNNYAGKQKVNLKYKYKYACIYFRN